jgi:hypothetical protein
MLFVVDDRPVVVAVIAYEMSAMTVGVISFLSGKVIMS